MIFTFDASKSDIIIWIWIIFERFWKWGQKTSSNLVFYCVLLANLLCFNTLSMFQKTIFLQKKMGKFCFALEIYEIFVFDYVYSCAYRFVFEMNMMIEIFDWNEPHTPMNFLVFYSKEEEGKRTKIHSERKNTKKSKEIKNEMKIKQNGMTEESLSLIYTFTFVLRHISVHISELYFVLYKKGTLTPAKCLLHFSISTSISNLQSDSI